MSDRENELRGRVRDLTIALENTHAELDRLRAIERCAREVVKEFAGDMTPTLGTRARLESALYMNWKAKQKLGGIQCMPDPAAKERPIEHIIHYAKGSTIVHADYCKCGACESYRQMLRDEPR